MKGNHTTKYKLYYTLFNTQNISIWQYGCWWSAL